MRLSLFAVAVVLAESLNPGTFESTLAFVIGIVILLGILDMAEIGDSRP